MTPFIYYMARSSLYLAVFLAFFLLVIRRTTFFRLNRIVLLAGSLLCLLLPAFHLRTVLVERPAAGVLEMVQDGTAMQMPGQDPSWPEILVWAYLLGAGAVLIGTAVSFFRMQRIIRQGTLLQSPEHPAQGSSRTTLPFDSGVRDDPCAGVGARTTLPFDSGVRDDPCAGSGERIVLLDSDVPSFSWGRTIVLSRSDYEAHPVILLHEQMHVRARHSMDLLAYTVLLVLHWFNPLVWIARTELKLLHEYEADEAVLKKGIDATKYQILLVRKAVGDERFSLANGFQHSKLKNRINMMLTTPTPGWKRLSPLAVLPILAAAMFFCNPVKAQYLPSAGPENDIPPVHVIGYQAPADTVETVPFSQVETLPSFQGQDAYQFARWLSTQLVYPASAKQAGKQGRVMLSFVVDEKGAVRDVRVLRSVDPALDAEAVRAVLSSPAWTPGRQNGQPVAVTYTFPVIFSLN